MGAQNQHYVPKFLIRNFCDIDGRVFRLDIQTDRITKPSPKRAASREGFYDFDINGRIISFEHQLQRIETRAAPGFRKIVETNSVSCLDKSERKAIADFIAIQSFRTEAFYEGLEHPLQRTQLAGMLTQLFRSAFLVSQEIGRRNWALMKIERGDHFYLGDAPIVLQMTKSPESAGQLGFDVEGVEAYFPLTPILAIYMPCRLIGNEIIAAYEGGLDLRDRLLNTGESADVLERVHEILIRQKEFYTALKKGVSFACAPENVENLNYLQCSWAYRAIYSDRSDFTFAKKVFSRTPQYRKAPRTKIAAIGSYPQGR